MITCRNCNSAREKEITGKLKYSRARTIIIGIETIFSELLCWRRRY